MFSIFLSEIALADVDKSNNATSAVLDIGRILLVNNSPGVRDHAVYDEAAKLLVGSSEKVYAVIALVEREREHHPVGPARVYSRLPMGPQFPAFMPHMLGLLH